MGHFTKFFNSRSVHFFCRLITVFLFLASVILPAVFRIDIWPLSTYPMFSWNMHVDYVWANRLMLHRKKENDDVLVPVAMRPGVYLLLEHGFKTENRALVKAIMHAGETRWPGPESSFDYLTIYKLSKKPGSSDLRDLQSEKKMEIPLFE